MISDSERQTIVKMATKYHAKRVLLFGSALSPDKESSDIDIAVEGIEEKDFFTFYGELMCALSRPVDVIDLSITSRFSELVNLKGMSLYT